MSSYKDLLVNVKKYVEWNNYKAAQKDLEKLLTLLKMEYESGSKDAVKSGIAFNKLLPVRKELISGNLTSVTYNALGIQVKNPAPAPKEVKPDYSVPSGFFDDIDVEAPSFDFDGKKAAPKPAPKQTPVKEEPKKEPEKEKAPEDVVLEKVQEEESEFQFKWDDIPTVKFEDIAGLDDVKRLVEMKVLVPLTNPDAYAGYENQGGGGLCLYGPPGTGKTMMAAAIANRINAKFCSVTPSDLIHQGAGNTEKSVKALFSQARKFKCSVIFFDEMDSIAPKSTRSQYARQLRSELLAQLQGIKSYGKSDGHILFLICATNKPDEIDSAFLRPGRFGTLIYVGLPDAPARRYIVENRMNKIKKKGIVQIRPDLDIDFVVDKTNGFNCADVTNLLSSVEELSVMRSLAGDEKYICLDDFKKAFKKIHSSVQNADIEKIRVWERANNATNAVLIDDEEEVKTEPVVIEQNTQEPKNEPEEPAPAEETPADNAPEKETPASSDDGFTLELPDDLELPSIDEDSDDSSEK